MHSPVFRASNSVAETHELLDRVFFLNAHRLRQAWRWDYDRRDRLRTIADIKAHNMKKIIIASIATAFAFSGLSACASLGGGNDVRILSANEAGVTYQVKSTKVSTTESVARAYCESRGRTAMLDRVTPVGQDANVSYFCR